MNAIVPADSINRLIPALKSGKGKLIAFHKRQRTESNFFELYHLVEKAAGYLLQQGIKNGDTVVIVSKNDLLWVVADLACIFCGIKLLPLEPGSDLFLYKTQELRVHRVLIASEYGEYIKQLENANFTCILLEDILKSSTAITVPPVPHRYHPQEVVSYKTTSGSTGIPKVLGQSVQSVNNSIQGTQQLFNHTSADRILVFLSLNLLQQRYWIYLSIIYDCTVIVVPKEYVFMSLKTERPSVIMGVPYIYEVLKDDFSKKINIHGEHRAAYEIFSTRRTGNGFLPFLNYLGGEIRYLWTGSAPISSETIGFYFNLGIPLYQGYGMNETCIIAKNYPGNNKIGSVGKVFPNINILFDENKQILVKSTYPVCSRYTFAPETENGKTFLDNGYVATGDLGYLDEENYLFINGRMKDIIVLSSSKKIFPRNIEERINDAPEIEQCVVYGDNRPYLVALIIPTGNTVADSAVHGIIERFNQNAKEEEKIYKVHINREKFTEANDFLSSQNKIKRQNIYSSFQNIFTSLYE
jgi:long-chain acyl-CoA synthetase